MIVMKTGIESVLRKAKCEQIPIEKQINNSSLFQFPIIEQHKQFINNINALFLIVLIFFF